MNYLSLKRDSAKVKKALYEKDGSIYTSVPLLLHIPKKYYDNGMLTLGESTIVVGMHGLILADCYAVSSVCSVIKTAPAKIMEVEVNGIDYFEMHYAKDTQYLVTKDLFVDDTIIYNIFESILYKGLVPWYFNYLDLGKIFQTANKYAGNRIGDNRVVIELIASILAREENNSDVFYRHYLNKTDRPKNPSFYALSSVTYSTKSVLTKLTGANFDEGITSALNNRSTSENKLEQFVRI